MDHIRPHIDGWYRCLEFYPGRFRDDGALAPGICSDYAQALAHEIVGDFVYLFFVTNFQPSLLCGSLNRFLFNAVSCCCALIVFSPYCFRCCSALEGFNLM